MALLATLGRLDNQEHSFYQELFQYAQFGKHPKQLEKFLDTHEENNFNIDYRNSEGQTALYVACLCGNEKIGNVLLKYGADCNARNSRNMTPVHVAAGSDRCSKEFLRFMLQNHAGDLRIKDDQNRRPFDLLSENLEFEKRQKGGLFSSINPAKKIQEDKKKFIEKVTAMQEALTALNTKQKIQALDHHAEMMANFRRRSTDENNNPANKSNTQITTRPSVMSYASLSREVKSMAKNQGNQNLAKLSKFLSRGVGMNETGFIPGGFGRIAFGTTGLSEISCIPYVPRDHLTKNVGELAYGSPPCFQTISGSYTNCDVSIKTLAKDCEKRSAQYSNLMVAELKNFAKLRHPNILYIMAAVKDNDGIPTELIFEKIYLGSLNFMMHGRGPNGIKIDTLEACKITKIIADALEHLHSTHKLAHNAVTSHAVLLVNEKTPKLGDLAYMTPFGKGGGNMKTNGLIPEQLWRWLPPEAFVDNKSWQPKGDTETMNTYVSTSTLPSTIPSIQNELSRNVAGDIYSLTAVLWEMLAGIMPWNRIDPYQVKHRLVSKGESLQVPPPLEEDHEIYDMLLPPTLERLLKHGLARQASKRMKSMQQLSSVLKRLIIVLEEEESIENQPKFEYQDNPNFEQSTKADGFGNLTMYNHDYTLGESILESPTASKTILESSNENVNELIKHARGRVPSSGNLPPQRSVKVLSNPNSSSSAGNWSTARTKMSALNNFRRITKYTESSTLEKSNTQVVLNQTDFDDVHRVADDLRHEIDPDHVEKISQGYHDIDSDAFSEKNVKIQDPDFSTKSSCTDIELEPHIDQFETDSEVKTLTGSNDSLNVEIHAPKIDEIEKMEKKIQQKSKSSPKMKVLRHAERISLEAQKTIEILNRSNEETLERMNLSPKRSTRSPKNDKVLKDLLPTWSPKSKRKISKRSPKKVSQTELFANQNIIHLGTKITPSSSMANSINTSHQNSPDRSSVHSKDSRRKLNRQLSIEDTTYPPSIEEFKRRTSSVSLRSTKIEEERNVKKCNSSPSRLQTSTRVSTPDDLYLDPKNNTINDETGVQLVDDSKYLSCLKDRTFSTEEDKTITEEDSPEKAWPEPPSKGYTDSIENSPAKSKISRYTSESDLEPLSSMSSNRFGSARRSLAMTPSKLTLDHKINMFEKGESLNSKPDKAVNASQARILECRLNRMNSMGVLESDTPDKRSHVIGSKIEQALSSKSCTSLFTKASGNSLPGSESEFDRVTCRRRQPTKIIAQESTPFTMKSKSTSLASTLSNVSHVESRNNSYNPPPENDAFKRPFEPKVREDDSGSTIDLMMSKININLEFSDDEDEKKDGEEEPRLSEAASEIACAMGVVADDYINGLLDVEKEVSKESSESSLKEDKGEKNDITMPERFKYTIPDRQSIRYHIGQQVNDKSGNSDNSIGMTFDETALNPLINSKNSQNFQKYEETTPYLPANDSDGETIDSSVKPFRSTAPSLASLKQTKSIEENTSVWSCNDQASHESISPIAKTSVTKSRSRGDLPNSIAEKLASPEHHYGPRF